LSGTDRASAQAPFWTLDRETVLRGLGCGAEGLAADEASRRLERYGPNADKPARRIGIAAAIARRLLEPLCLILLAAAIVSALTGDDIGGAIIVAILALSIGLDTVQDFTDTANENDILEFSTSIFADFAAVQAAMSQVGADVLITVDASNTVTLKSVTLSNLGADDFRLVA